HGFELKIGLFAFVVEVLVTWTSAVVERLNRYTSGLKSGFPAPVKFGVPAKFLVDINAIILPSSLMDASRLSSATNGGTVALPGDGARLAVVLVILAKVPAVRSIGPTLAPLVRFNVSSGTVN